MKSAMQKMFLPTSAISAPLRENAQRFWENQEKVLDSMQALANGWFERRHTGSHKAREAAERMCQTQTFVDLIQAYQDWAGGAFRADHGRRTCVPAANHGGNRRACIAAIGAFGNRKGGRTPAIRVEGPGPL